MLLLGVLASQAEAAAPVAAGAYDLLETEILTGSQSSVTFSSLNSTYGADYQHLQLRMTTRTTRAASGNDLLEIQFNGDTGSNYASHYLLGDGSAVSSAASINKANIWGSVTPRAGVTANVFGASTLDILDPFESTKNTTTRAFSGTLDSVWLISGHWRNTNALTSILLKPQTDSFAVGSRFSLYGLKKGA